MLRAAIDNQLLRQLAPRARKALLAGGQPLLLESGATLVEPGHRLRHAFFPIDSAISVIVSVTGQPQTGVSLIGSEGMLGLPLILGASTSSLRAVVQAPGHAWRVDAPRFARQLLASAPLRVLLQGYVHVRYLQMAETAACKNFHRLDGRLARWLLMSRDRARSGHITLTHEFLAHMLGVRRAGVSQAASALQKLLLIRYSRGHIELLNPKGLEALACVCYANDKQTYARFMH